MSRTMIPFAACAVAVVLFGCNRDGGCYYECCVETEWEGELYCTPDCRQMSASGDCTRGFTDDRCDGEVAAGEYYEFDWEWRRARAGREACNSIDAPSWWEDSSYYRYDFDY